MDVLEEDAGCPEGLEPRELGFCRGTVKSGTIVDSDIELHDQGFVGLIGTKTAEACAGEVLAIASYSSAVDISASENFDTTGFYGLVCGSESNLPALGVGLLWVRVREWRVDAKKNSQCWIIEAAHVAEFFCGGSRLIEGKDVAYSDSRETSIIVEGMCAFFFALVDNGEAVGWVSKVGKDHNNAIFVWADDDTLFVAGTDGFCKLVAHAI